MGNEDEIYEDMDDKLEAVQEYYYVVKCMKFKMGNYVVVSRGTRFGSSSICKIKEVKPKTLWLLDPNGNQFWKSKSYCSKIKFLTYT